MACIKGRRFPFDWLMHEVLRHEGYSSNRARSGACNLMYTLPSSFYRFGFCFLFIIGILSSFCFLILGVTSLVTAKVIVA